MPKRRAIGIGVHGLCLLLACTGPARVQHAPAAVVDELPSPPASHTPKVTVELEPEPAIDSVHDHIYAALEADPEAAIVLFSDHERGVVAVSDTGSTLQLLEPYPDLVVDYQSGLLWLHRAWDDEHQNGLFVADLFAPQLDPRYVSLPRASWQLINAAGETYPIGSAAYTTVISSAGVHTSSVRACRDDACEVPPEVAELVTEAVARGYPVEPRPRLEVIGVDDYRLVRPDPDWAEAGRLVELPGIRWDAISVATMGDVFHVQWNLYDPVAGTYHSAKTLEASKQPWNIEAVIVHLMICREQTAIVLDHRLFSAEGELLFEASFPSRGMCLHGGAVFDARDLLLD